MTLIARLSEGQVGIIERSGKYLKTIFPGALHFLIPVIDTLTVHDLRPKTYDLPMVSILLKKSFTIDLNLTMKYKIMEPWKARYEVENKDLEYTIERFIIKSLSSAMSEMTLEEAIAAKNDLANHAKRQLENISKNWGFKLLSLEIKAMKKSFLAEQEKEKLYDIHKTEKGVYMSEKVDLKDPAKAIHYTDEEETSEEIVKFTHLTENITPYFATDKNEEANKKIQELETQAEEISDENLKETSRQQLEILKEHQSEMLKLQEKDLKQQQEELMYQISEMGKKQEELIAKQKELLEKQQHLDTKKQAVDKIVENNSPDQIT